MVAAALTAGLLCSGSAAAQVPVAHTATSQLAASQPAAAPAAPAPAAPAPAAGAPAAAAAPAAPAPAAPAPAAPKPAVAAPTLVAGTPCSSTARACVDLSARKAWLISGGQVVYGPVPITSGRAGYRTPTGTYRVQFKDIDHKSSLFEDAPMPYSVFFNGGVAFHQGSLKVLSHGCVHLSPAAARTFFGSLKVGDVVAVRP